MHPFWILLAGMVIVIGGILALRLHAFLALLLGALVVAWLTPEGHVFEHELRSRALRVQAAEGATVVLAAGIDAGLAPGTRLQLFRQAADGPGLAAIGTLEVIGAETATATAGRRAGEAYRPGDFVVPLHEIRAARDVAGQTIGEQVATGFGRTCLAIGILIAMAAIIGKCLLESGGAERIVEALRGLLGERRTPVAFLGSGFLVGIPVFFDTVFYLLLPLAKAMRMKTGRNYLLYVLAIVAGGTMAHSLVPPTPGPLFVASALGVDIGLMILGGIAVGLFTITVGYLYAKWANRRWDLPLRATAELTGAELERLARRDDRPLPGLALALTPIVLPVLLIAGQTVLDMTDAASRGEMWAVLASWMDVVGNKNVALVLAAAAALWMLARVERGEGLSEAVQAALAGGGVIILITAAGGAFGYALRLTGIAGALQDVAPASQAALLPLAFGLTTLVRIAQGSATVAMITAVGIVAPLASAGTLAFHPLYLALAIGCGSKPISWMNDSGFWIIGRMSGMTEAETLRTASVQIALMGVVGLFVTMLAAWIWPLV